MAPASSTDGPSSDAAAGGGVYSDSSAALAADGSEAQSDGARGSLVGDGVGAAATRGADGGSPLLRSVRALLWAMWLWTWWTGIFVLDAGVAWVLAKSGGQLGGISVDRPIGRKCAPGSDLDVAPCCRRRFWPRHRFWMRRRFSGSLPEPADRSACQRSLSWPSAAPEAKKVVQLRALTALLCGCRPARCRSTPDT